MLQQMTLFAELPLPERIAQQFGFQLLPREYEGRRVYLVSDWIAGVAGTDRPEKLWSDTIAEYPELSDLVGKLPVKRSNGRTYKMDHADSMTLYLITVRLRAKSGIRDQVIAIMVKSTEFADWATRNPDQAAELFTDMAKKQGKHIPLPQSKDYRLARHSGYDPDQAEQTAKIRGKLKEQQTITNDVRKAHGAHNGDFAKLNALDSEVATGKTPGEWKEEYGTDKSPADFHSALDRAMLYYTKRKAAKVHEQNQSRGLKALANDVRSIQPEVDENREILQEILSDEPLQLPAPKAKQTKFLKDGK